MDISRRNAGKLAVYFIVDLSLLMKVHWLAETFAVTVVITLVVSTIVLQ